MPALKEDRMPCFYFGSNSVAQHREPTLPGFRRISSQAAATSGVDRWWRCLVLRSDVHTTLLSYTVLEYGQSQDLKNYQTQARQDSHPHLTRTPG